MFEGKVAQFSPNVAQIKVTAILIIRAIFQKTPNVAQYLGNFCKKNCSQGLSKIDQSGHTALKC